MPVTNEQGISQLAKTVMTFIDRVGFPIFAFIMMCFICFISIDRMNKAVQNNTNVLIEVSTAFKAFQSQVQLDHRTMIDELRRK